MPDDQLHLRSSDRAFKYGDAIFESCLFFEGRLPLMSYHFERLTYSMQCLSIVHPPHITMQWLTDIITELAKEHGLTTARAKITVWRGGGGLYLPQGNEPELLIEIFPLQSPPFSDAPRQYAMGEYKGLQKVIHPVSACKTANALPYILAAMFASDNGFDDALIFNTEAHIADAITANVWMFENNALITTPELNGGVKGTMQSWLVENAASFGYEVLRKPLTSAMLMTADAVFVTNAIQGIIPVTSFRSQRYSNNLPIALLRDVKSTLLA